MRFNGKIGSRSALHVVAAFVLAASVVGGIASSPVVTARAAVVPASSGSAGPVAIASAADVSSAQGTFSAPSSTDDSGTMARHMGFALIGYTATQTITPVKTKKPRRKLSVRQIVAKVGRNAGLSKRELTALLWICKRESNFHPTSHSRSNCHGLFQLSAGMANGHPWKDPSWNTKRAIRYMRGRYGGVLQAKSFWLSHHWY